MNLLHVRSSPVSLFVNGTLMRGLDLHRNLADAAFLGVARTAPRYRLYSVRDEHPAMLAAPPGDGTAITGELYDLGLSHLQRVLASEPVGLGLSVIDLETGDTCLGIIWTAARLPRRAIDVSAFGGWREYQASLGTPSRPPD